MKTLESFPRLVGWLVGFVLPTGVVVGISLPLLGVHSVLIHFVVVSVISGSPRYSEAEA